MGKRNHSNYPVDLIEEDFEVYPDIVTCPECGSDNIYPEVITAEEWAGHYPVNKSVTRYTCLNERCGHSWEVPA